MGGGGGDGGGDYGGDYGGGYGGYESPPPAQINYSPPPISPPNDYSPITPPSNPFESGGGSGGGLPGTVATDLGGTGLGGGTPGGGSNPLGDLGVPGSPGGGTGGGTSFVPGYGDVNLGQLSNPAGAAFGQGPNNTADSMTSNSGSSFTAPASQVTNNQGFTTPGVNVSPTQTGGIGPSGGLPGVGDSRATDLSSQSKDQNRANIASGTTTNDSGSVMKSLGINNPIGTAIGAAGLGYAMSQGAGPLANQAARVAPEQLASVTSYLESVKSTVGPQSADANAKSQELYGQGQKLVNYLQTGTLPPGDLASLEQAKASAKATIISRMASQGLSTDPTQNSSLAAELAKLDQQSIISQQQLEQQYQQSGMALVQAADSYQKTSASLTQTGLNAAGLSSDLYKTLVGIDQTQQKAMGDAIANFARATSGGGGGTTIKLG